MEMALFVWLASVLPSIGELCGAIASIVAIYCIIKVIVAAVSRSEYDRELKPEVYKNAGEILKFKWLKRPCAIIVLFSVVSVIIPSQKTLYLMLGAYAGQSLVQSETADKMLKIVNGKLDEYLVEIEEKVEASK